MIPKGLIYAKRSGRDSRAVAQPAAPPPAFDEGFAVR